MSTVATIWVKLGLDSKGYNSGLDSASQKTGSLAGKMGKGLAIGAGLAAAAIGGATIALGGIIKSATMATARVEELKVVNEVLAKTAGIPIEAVRKEAQEIRDAGIQASVAERTVAEFIRANLDLGKASDIARIAQDAAVISGIDSSEATDRIIQGITKLNPLILRNAGIVVDLQAAYEEYGAEMGISAADLTTAQKQQAAMNAVMESGESIAGAYTAAMSQPGKLLRSFPRYFNDIMVSMGEPFQEPFARLLFSLKDLVEWVGSAVSEGGSLRPVLEGLAEKAGQFADYLAGLVETFIEAGPYSSEFKEALTAMLPPELQTKFFEITNAIESMVTGIGGIKGGFGSLLETLSPFLTLISGIGGIIFKSLLPAFQRIAEVIGPLIDEYMPPFIEMISSLAMTILDTLLPPFMSLVEKILPIVIDLFGTVIEAIMPLISAILPPLIDLVLMVIEAFLPLIEMALPVLTELLVSVIEAIAPLLEAVLPLLILLIESWLAVMMPLLEVAFPILLKIIEFFSEFIQNVTIPTIEKLAKFINDKVVPAINAISDALQPVIDWLEKMGGAIGNLKIADAFNPGSPTPFELGLLGIESALKRVARQGLPELQAGLELSAVGVPTAGLGGGSSEADTRPMMSDAQVAQLGRMLSSAKQREH